jgi:hypothetical protein
VNTTLSRVIGLFRKRLPYRERAARLSVRYASPILFSQEGNNALREHVNNGTPFFISRIGSTELRALNHFLNQRDGKASQQPYPQAIRKAIWEGPGVFPADESHIDQFCQIYSDAIKEVTSLGVWFNEDEWAVANRFCPKALLVDLGCLEPYFFRTPYTSFLTKKKVLVIHPFSTSIKKQYETNRDKLFLDPDVLPEFEMLTLKPPQSIACNTDGYFSWSQALADLQGKVDSLDYDVAIIGAGGYGLPLGAHIKRSGRSVIHLGGATQILFGIKGRRWETEYDYHLRLFNEHWIYPSKDERPTNFSKVEKGCYW